MADTLKTMPVASLSDVTPDSADKFILYRDDDKGAYVVKYEELIEAMAKNLTDNDLYWEMANMGSHNAVYRGKYLGDQVTDEQWAEIKAGTFNDLFIGDYWTINGYNFVIGDFDYWYNSGDSGYACGDHHILIVPEMLYYDTYMNSSNTTSGGYVGSYMYATGLGTAKTIINNAFGSAHILNHREYLTNAITSGYPSAGAWYDSTVELMNEEMVYGSPIKQQMCYGGTNITTNTLDNSQLALFRFSKPAMIAEGSNANGQTIGSRYIWWLRDIASAASFCYVSNSGYALTGNASAEYGVRPAFAIYQS